MRIELHIGLEHCGASRLQSSLADGRDALISDGVLYPTSPGNRNHTRLWMAMTDPEHVDPLRAQRGYAKPDHQAALRDTLIAELTQEVAKHSPDVLILSASQLCWLASRTELERLRDLLAPISSDIRVTAHVDEQARLMARLYAAQIADGRTVPLDQEVSLAAGKDWWSRAQKFAPELDPSRGQFIETQSAPFWLDYQNLINHWEAVFGAGNVALRSFDADVFFDPDLGGELKTAFNLKSEPPVSAAPVPSTPSGASLTRARLLNELLWSVIAGGKYQVPRPLWHSFHEDIAVDGAPIDPGSLSAISRVFADSNSTLCQTHSGLDPASLTPPAPAPDWEEPDAQNGYRASQYLLAFKWRLDKAQKRTTHEDPAFAKPHALTDTARALMPPLAVQNFKKLKGSPFAPHNRLGAVNEEALAAAYTPIPPRKLKGKKSGNVIVGCMKNEAPYIIEWVAYHRAIGVDNFLIYTNGCEDGTSEMLDRLQDMGVLEHRLNDDWKGKSPQQHALNRSLKEPVIKHADWVIHIDVDEFMNIRCGNGTLNDLFARIPNATNVAMTWRLFGHNGVTELSDDLVIDQFDTCAPKYCPKPHTVWGFKTMFKNIGAYEKISCHRPNKLVSGMEDSIKWVNGSGQDMTREVASNGWRNSMKSIGYDLIQLNHYALRSAESFLVKRQRGRALHVDRSIGLNYWIRMDWSDFRDITIKRNIPRVRAEYDRLMQDDALRKLHEDGLSWHRAKAEELHTIPEFRELYEQALKVKLTETERVAYALALDMDS